MPDMDPNEALDTMQGQAPDPSFVARLRADLEAELTGESHGSRPGQPEASVAALDRPDPRSGHRRSLIVALGAAAVIVLLAFAAVLAAVDDGDSELDTTGQTESGEPSVGPPAEPDAAFVVEEFAVDHVGNATDDGEFGWVAGADGVLSKLDLESGEVIDELGFPAVEDGGYVASGFDSIWVTDSAKGLLHRIDTDSGAVTSIGIPGAFWVMTDNDAVWVTTNAANEVHRVDPESNRVIAVVDVGPGDGVSIVNRGDEFVYATSGDRLHQIDPATNEITNTIDVANGSMAAGTRGPWIPGDPAGTVRRYDPVSLQPAGTTKVTGTQGEPVALVALHDDGTSLWQLYVDGDRSGVARIDPVSDSVLAQADLVPGAASSSIQGGPAGVWLTLTGETGPGSVGFIRVG